MALSLWFVVLAVAVAVVAESAAAGGIAIALFGLGFAATVLVAPELLPSTADSHARRYLRRTTAASVALVIAAFVLVGVHAQAVFALVAGVLSAVGSGGVALLLALR